MYYKSHLILDEKMSRKRVLKREVDVDKLQKIRKQEDDPKVRDRILGIIMIEKGMKKQEIADLLSITDVTLWRWTKSYNEKGIDGLIDEDRSGRNSKLSTEEKEDLKQTLKKKPKEVGYEKEAWSTKLVLHHIKKEYSVEYHPRYIQDFLRDLGFELKKPRPKHYKSSEKERKEYYKEVKPLKKN